MDPDVEFLRSVLPPTTDPAFFQFLLGLDCSGVTLRSVPEGSVAFARVSFRVKPSQPGRGWGVGNRKLQLFNICRCL